MREKFRKPDLSKLRLVEPFPPTRDVFEAELSDLIDKYSKRGLTLKSMQRSLLHRAQFLRLRRKYGQT
jgi:hypothetical protein